jgi:hypothetical protein
VPTQKGLASWCHFWQRLALVLSKGPHHNNNPELFWQLHWDDNNLLAKPAIRVFHTLTNEVPSQRVFSAMKILHSKTRNRLREDRVDKLLFIQINLRTLRRHKRQPRSELQSKKAYESESGRNGRQPMDCLARLQRCSNCWNHPYRPCAAYISWDAPSGVAGFWPCMRTFGPSHFSIAPIGGF